MLRRTIAGSNAACSDLSIGLYGEKFGAIYKGPTGCAALLQFSSMTVQTNTWYHVAVSIDGSTARLYVNGLLQDSGATLANYTPVPVFQIGAAACCGGDSFGGLVDEVEVFNRALTATEVQAIFNAGSAGKCKATPTPTPTSTATATATPTATPSSTPTPTPTCSTVQVFDLSADWSNMNPNVVWTYGMSATLGGAITPFALFDTNYDPGLQLWRPVDSFAPSFVHNWTLSQVVLQNERWEPGETSFHPGPNGERCVVRFTAPSIGNYEISASFAGINIAGTTTDVHVRVNGAEVFGAEVIGFGPASAQTYTGSHTLSADDIVDCVVGFGANGNYFSDARG